MFYYLPDLILDQIKGRDLCPKVRAGRLNRIGLFVILIECVLSIFAAARHVCVGLVGWFFILLKYELRRLPEIRLGLQLLNKVISFELYQNITALAL